VQKHQSIFTKKKLVAAVSLAIVGGISGCSSDSGGGGAAAVFAFLANGGLGGNMSGGNGGDGGRLYMFNDGATGGVEVRKTGAANTNFTTPVTPGTPDLGDNPLAITADTTLTEVDDDSPVADGAGALAIGENYIGDDDVIRTSVAGGVAVYATDTLLANGTAYMRDSDDRIAIHDAPLAANHSVVTGLSVAEGAILTLSNNSGCSSRVKVSKDIDNMGTITKELNQCSITLQASMYFGGDIFNAGDEDFENGGGVYIQAGNGIENNGNINTSGFDEENDVNGDENGGNGGSIRLSAGGFVLNAGMLDSSGGDGTVGMGTNGGNGGEVTLSAAYTENNGAITNRGGAGSAEVGGQGGDGRYVYIVADYVANNTADIDASGGAGSQGGDGGEVVMANSTAGEVKNAGAINLNGGNAVGSSGGDGGEFGMITYLGSSLNSGDITATGGDTTEASSDGGDGGELIFIADGGDAGSSSQLSDEPGDVAVSGNLNVSGGNAAAAGDGNGGDGGEVSLSLHNLSESYSNQRVSLFGYLSIDANGGDGADAGDAVPNGGEISVTLFADDEENDITQKQTVGTVLNEVPINAYGGNSTAGDADPVGYGDGGEGGSILVMTSQDNDIQNLNSSARNTGDINVNGGNAFGDGLMGSRGGDGGEFHLIGFSSAENTGNYSSNGGDGGEYGGDGSHYSGGFNVESVSGQARNAGDLSMSGANGIRNGGHGGNAIVFGSNAVNAGSITVNGANATRTDPLVGPGYGGDGGEIAIVGGGLNKATNSGDLSYTMGTGITRDGDEGCARVDITFEGNCSSGGPF